MYANNFYFALVSDAALVSVDAVVASYDTAGVAVDAPGVTDAAAKVSVATKVAGDDAHII